MFKNLKMSLKLSLGFGVLALLILVVGGFSWISLGRVADSTRKVERYQEMLNTMFLARQRGKDFLVSADPALPPLVSEAVLRARSIAQEIRPSFSEAADLKRLDDIAASKAFQDSLSLVKATTEIKEVQCS